MDDKKKNGLIIKLSNALKKNKKLEIAFYIGLALFILLLYLSTIFPNNEKTTAGPAQISAAASETSVEERLSSVLSKIKGAGHVEVMITYETGPELITAMSTDVNTNSSVSTGEGKESSTEQQTSSQKPATINNSGGTSPIVLTEKQPVVRGVIVVAEGAENISVRLNLMRAVQTVLNVPEKNIEVFVSEKQGTQSTGRE